jgi:hypothetical protein
MPYDFGYTPYWNLSIDELLRKARVAETADKALQDELARRVDLLALELEEARATIKATEDELRDLRRSGVPSNCSYCGESFIDD